MRGRGMRLACRCPTSNRAAPSNLVFEPHLEKVLLALLLALLVLRGLEVRVGELGQVKLGEGDLGDG
jgi:hypothetical protein